MNPSKANPYAKLVEKLEVDGTQYKFYNLTKLQDERYGKSLDAAANLFR